MAFSTTQVMAILVAVCIAEEVTGFMIPFNKTQVVREQRGATWEVPHRPAPYMGGEKLGPILRDEIIASLNRQDRDTSNTDFRPLCETETRLVHLEDSEYEYRPTHYHEILCKTYATEGEDLEAIVASNQRCVFPGFSCRPRTQNLYFLRRLFDSNCWEAYIKKVDSGCDCMWPESRYGEISNHY